MVAVPRLHEMKYSETRQSAKIIEPTKHWKIDTDVNLQLIIDTHEHNKKQIDLDVVTSTS